ncbi:MAG: hypothetical protein KatS3mg010_1696 [Acidimicrobiia bacterium]|nr:MAG: hypothetical protein KatS3mg010_1696 [Acidimicrobiia bacterium]
MNLQQLRYLVATADGGSMTRAATACHVAQPVLSRALRSLERELGVPLLVRGARGVELTVDGRRVVDAARRALDEVERIEELGRSRRLEHGVLAAVATTPTLESELGAGLAPSFWKRHPDFGLRFVHCGSSEHVVAAVLEGRADVGLCDLPVAAERLVVVPLEEREVVLIAPPGTELPDPVPLAALGDVPLILPVQGSERRRAFDALFATIGITPIVAFESDERAAWIPTVLAGQGCCIWYRSHGDRAEAAGALIRSFDPPLRREIGVVHPDGPLAAAAAAFVALAAERATIRRSRP